MQRCQYCVTILVIALVDGCISANILVISPVSSLSHGLWNQKLANFLATDCKHHVTVLDVNEEKIKTPNVTHVHVKIPMILDAFHDLEFYSKQTSPIFALNIVLDWMDTISSDIFSSPVTRKFLDQHQAKRKPFDLIVMDGACCSSLLGFVERFGNPPLIQQTAYSSSTYLKVYAGNYDNPAYAPFGISPFTSEMNFLERVENTALYLYYFYRYHSVHISEQNRIAKSFFGDDISDISELSRRPVVTLLNLHPAVDGVKPLMPNIVPIGGFHIQPPNPLQQNLKTFLDDSEHGVIYFSFGSNLKCTDMDEAHMNIFLKVFKEMKEKVVWKCERTDINLPENVFFGKWFNQSDVLAHPNVKVFISHGGLLGSQEAIYHGVPILVCPFIVDQHINAERLVKKGVAVRINYAELTAEVLKNSLQKLLTDPSYQRNMREISLAFRDNPMTARELIKFWVDYVLRHPKTNLLRPVTQTMPIYQILLLDVAAFFITVIVGISFILFTLLKMMFRICRTNGKKVKIN